MDRHDAQPIGDLLTTYLRESGLEKPLLERQVVEKWPELMGPMVARLTRSVELTNGMLKVRISSAALKAQLFENRRELVAKLNEAVGAHIIDDVRLLG